MPRVRPTTSGAFCLPATSCTCPSSTSASEPLESLLIRPGRRLGDEVGYVEQARAGFERWVTALDTEFALFRSGDRSAAVQAAVGANRDLRKSYEAALAEARRSADQAVDQDEGAVNEASSWSWVVLAILAVALIGGCFIATWLVRSVIVPLNTLANLLGRTGR